MATTAKTLTPAQMHLLKLFAYNNSDEFAREIQDVLTRHFQEKLEKEVDRLWDEGVFSDEILDKWMDEDVHSNSWKSYAL